jgi:hypothetical protein
MRSFTTLLAAGLVLSSAPAFAAAKTNPEKQPDAKTATASIQPADAKYCVDQNPDEATGSRIYTHECHTKAEWVKRGVDIDETQRQQ